MNITGKVLRINRNGTIPLDNPIPNSPVYTSGHRNMFGIVFDKTHGMGVVAENGATHYDEVNVLKRGPIMAIPPNNSNHHRA